MSAIALQDFCDYLKGNQHLIDQVREQGKVDFVDFGKEHGFEFTSADLAERMKKVDAGRELSEEDLEEIRGGTAVEYAVMLALIIVVC